MKKTVILALTSALVATVMTGCNSEVPGLSTKPNKVGTQAQCDTVAKRLIQVDEFIVRIEATPESQVGELVVALSDTRFTTSTNKKSMLKDARIKKAGYEQDQRTMQCKTK